MLLRIRERVGEKDSGISRSTFHNKMQSWEKLDYDSRVGGEEELDLVGVMRCWA